MLPKHSTLIHPSFAHKFSTTSTHNPKTHFSTFAPSSQTSPQNPIGHLLQKCIALVQCCASSNSKLKQIHGFSIRHGVPLSNPDMGKHLIFFIVSLSAPISYAHQIFSQIENPNVFTWNTMIRGYAECQNPAPVIQLYHQMHQSSVQPDTHTYPFLLKAVAKLMDVGEGEKIHSVVVRNGFESLVFVKNALLHVYACCGHVESAHKMFESMSERDLVAWNSVINGFALNGRPNEALTIFRDMNLEGVEPDGFTMVSLLSACAEIGTLALGRRIHVYMLKVGLTENLHAMNALLDLYAKCGSIREAQKVFEAMDERCVVSRTALVVDLEEFESLRRLSSCN